MAIFDDGGVLPASWPERGSRVRAGSGEPAGQAGGYRQAGLDLRQDGRRESPGREGDRAGEEGRPARLAHVRRRLVRLVPQAS